MTWNLPIGTASFTVRISPPDALAADNTAQILLPVEGSHHVTLQTDTSDLYRRALAGMPGVAVDTDRTAPGDVTVIAGALPNPLPAGPLLLINPGGPSLPARGTLQNVRAGTPETAHPLLAGLDFGALLVQKGQQIDPPTWLEPLISAPSGPLLLAGVLDGRRVVVLTFDPADSNLPKLAAFPVLLTNAVDWLDPLVEAGALPPGAVVPLPPGATVSLPDNTEAKVGESGLFVATEQAGRYRVQRGGRSDLTFQVNAGDADEAALAPQAHPELSRPAPVDNAGGRQEAWRPLAALALLLVGADWFVYCRRRGQA
jgi:hypothetical protein